MPLVPYYCKMGSSLLRFICRKSAAGISKPSYCGVDRRMISTAAATEPSSTTSPWLMLQPAACGDGGGGADYKFYSLALNKVVSLNKPPPPTDGGLKLVGSSHGWLASHSPDNHHVYLDNPISGRRMRLPILRFPVEKLLLTSSPTAADCLALLTYSGRYNRLALCLPAAAAAEWTRLLTSPNEYVFSRRHRLLFCITYGSKIEVWDLTDPGSPEPVSVIELLFPLKKFEPDPIDGEERYRYLVYAEQSDLLFMVSRRVLNRRDRPSKTDVGRKTYRTVGFDVHEIDWRNGEIRCVDDGCLEGLAMFVGTNHSFALPAAEFPGLKPDSVYFTDDGYREFPHSYYGGHDIGVFSYADRSVSSVYYPATSSCASAVKRMALWFTPSMQ